MIFKLYDCDIGVTVRGTNYDFVHVDSVTIDNPERTRLTRGANAGNAVGISYTEGSKEAKTVTVPTMDIPVELFDLLKDVYKRKERIDFYCIARSDGSSKIGKNCVLSQEPMQLTMDDSAESMAIALVFETFDISEKHKS